MNLSQLAGNAPLKRQLELETARRGLSHAYILSGQRGSGRHTLARLLCAALVCTGAGERPCRNCTPCRKVRQGIHPDVRWVGDDGKDITVGQVRALRSDAYIRPNEAQRKVYVIENAQTMNASAQNAMLKLLEEGPAYAAFLLLTDNAAALLPTVRSRCEVLALSPVTQEQALSWLREAYPDRPAAQLQALAGRCEGLLGRAVAELEGVQAEDEAVTDTALALLERFAQRDERGLLELCVGLEKWDRDKLCALLEESVQLLRCALCCAVGRTDETDARRQAAARQAAGARSARELTAAVDKLERLRTACGFYVGAGHLAGWMAAALFS